MVKPRTRPCPYFLWVPTALPWAGGKQFSLSPTGICVPQGQPDGGGGAVPRGDGKSGWPSSSPGWAPGPGHSQGRAARLAAALSRAAPVARRHRAKQCWLFCKPGVTPSPEATARSPVPLIRTCRLGPGPPQARADFSGRETCKLFPVCSLWAPACRSFKRRLTSPGWGLGRCSCGLLWLPGAGLARRPRPLRAWHVTGTGKGLPHRRGHAFPSPGRGLFTPSCCPSLLPPGSPAREGWPGVGRAGGHLPGSSLGFHGICADVLCSPESLQGGTTCFVYLCISAPTSWVPAPAGKSHAPSLRVGGIKAQFVLPTDPPSASPARWIGPAPAHRQLLSKPGPRFPLGEGPHGWAG